MTGSPAPLRRARPLLGTLVEAGARGRCAGAALDAAFGAMAEVQAQLSRFEPGSDIARFNAVAAGTALGVGAHTRRVLRAARRLRAASDGAFDITLGTGADAWRLDGSSLRKLRDGASIDLGGIGKGYAVDCAVVAMRGTGCRAGWVNAGGDLRAFGALRLPVLLRDEATGTLRRLGMLERGALATSRYGAHARSRLHAPAPGDAHLSVLARRCLWADALTKIGAAGGDAATAAIARFGGRAIEHR